MRELHLLGCHELIVPSAKGAVVDVYLICVFCFVEVAFGRSGVASSAAIGYPQVHEVVCALLEQY